MAARKDTNVKKNSTNVKKNSTNAKPVPGEERFVATGKSVVLIKPGKGAQNASSRKKGK